MTTTFQATAITGQRWDQIADNHYLDPYAYADIVGENFMALGQVEQFIGGESVDVPVQDVTTPTTENLPPWRR